MKLHLLHLKNETGYVEVQFCPSIDSLSENQRNELKIELQAEHERRGQKKAKASISKHLVRTLTAAEKEAARSHFARVIVMSNSPFLLCDASWWKPFFQSLLTDFDPPSRKFVAGKFLDEEYERVQKRVLGTLSGHKYVQLCSDGWTNQRGESIIGYTASIPRADFLLTITYASQVFSLLGLVSHVYHLS